MRKTAMAKNVTTDSSRVDDLLAEAVAERTTALRGSLIFALDATGSREPTWDLAAHLQLKMFDEAARIGSLDAQLVYFSGGHGEFAAKCKSSKWTSDPKHLAILMSRIRCEPGLTQIGRVLTHTLDETSRRKISAMVFVGDSFEELPEHVMPQARRLSEHNVPVFVFQEEYDREAETAFRGIARVSRGAYHRFDAGSAKQLGELLRAVAVFAVGGAPALEKQNTESARRLLTQLR
jgi:hypothetical protein